MPKPPILPTLDWQKIFNSGQTWEAWMKAAENKSNRKRMQTIYDGLALPKHVEAGLKALERPVHVVAIAEDWCGDVVRHAPVMARLAAAGRKVRLRFITREQHPDVFIRFLTNGGEAIPKFIFLSDQFVECGNWGPMPDSYRELISRGKACGDVGAARKMIGVMYDNNIDQPLTLRELAERIDIAATPTL